MGSVLSWLLSPPLISLPLAFYFTLLFFFLYIYFFLLSSAIYLCLFLLLPLLSTCKWRKTNLTFKPSFSFDTPFPFPSLSLSSSRFHSLIYSLSFTSIEKTFSLLLLLSCEPETRRGLLSLQARILQTSL